MSELSSLSLSEIRAGLSAKTFSVYELTSAYVARIEKYKELNAYIGFEPERALKAATDADANLSKNSKAALAGIPCAVKDVIVTREHKTTCGSRMLKDFISPYDASVIKRLFTAGAFVLGKTNMDEFAMGSSNENSFFGPVRNPWDFSRVPGGTSGGSSAAVAAELAPFALGTDTGGSVRQPAAYCNVVGIKPTYGRVSRYGLVAHASSLDQVGVFARNALDCAHALEAICGHDPLDSTSVEKAVPNFGASVGKPIKGLRLGVPKEYFITGLNPEIQTAVRTALDALTKLGANIVEISLPHTELALAVYYVLAPAEASSNLARFDGVRYGYRASQAKDLAELYARTRAEGFGAEVKRRIMMGTYVLSAGYYDAYYLRAQKVRTLIIQDFSKAFGEKCDLIVCPTAPTTAFKLGDKTTDPVAMYLNDIFTIPVSLAGLPGMSIPCGFDSQKLPIGLQLIGQPWDEETLFKVASAYETVSDWTKRRPLQ